MNKDNPMPLSTECRRSEHSLCVSIHYCQCICHLDTKINNDMVTHPAHYTQHPKGIECIDVVEDNPFYNLGAAMKYLWRVSWGSKGNDIEDLNKAGQYIEFEITRRTNKTVATMKATPRNEHSD